jgi:hypothetical protein
MEALGRPFSSELTNLHKETAAAAHVPIRYADLREHPQAEVLRQLDVRGESGFRGDHFVVGFDPERSSETTVAHELIHVLLNVRGYPQIHAHNRPIDLAVRLLNTEISDRVLHLTVYDELQRRRFDVSSDLDTRRSSHLEAAKARVPEESAARQSRELEEGLYLVEARFHYPSAYREILGIVRELSPGAAELGQKLVEATKTLGWRSAQQSRRLAVRFLTTIDEHLQPRGIDSDALGNAIVVPVFLSTKQAEAPAGQVFSVRSFGMRDTNGPFVRSNILYTPDGSVVQEVTTVGTDDSAGITRQWEAGLSRGTAEQFLARHRGLYARGQPDGTAKVVWPPA